MMPPADLLNSAIPESDHGDWVQRLEHAYTGIEDCGFAIYIHPALLVEARLGKVQARYDSLFEGILDTFHFGIPAFGLQPLAWPQHLQYDAGELERETEEMAPVPTAAYDDYSDSDDSEVEYAGPEDLVYINLDRGRNPRWARSIYKQCRVLQGPDKDSLPESYNSAILNGRDASPDLKRLFTALRMDYQNVRSRPRIKTSAKELSIQSGTYDSLVEGILDNCFIVVDPYSAFTWWDTTDSEGCWMWVVDPHFVHAGTETSSNGLTDDYQGYLRVEMQQLCGEFLRILLFEGRPLRQLWEAARYSKYRAFASMNAGSAIPMEH